MILGAAAVTPSVVLVDSTMLFNPALLPIALAVAVLSSALPYTLEMYALTRMPNQVFSLFMSVEPALAALMGAVVLHEQLTSLQWLAIVCVMAASFGSAMASQRRTSS
jgi:inner membrane transporter RhtA